MKKIYAFCTVFLFCSWTSFGQLTGMNPAIATHAQVLTTTISSTGIFIQSSSPCGNIFSIKLTRGADIIEAFQYDAVTNGTGVLNVINANTVDLNLTVPITVMDGVYDLEVVTGDPINPITNQTTYSLPSAFTITPPDGYITGTVYDDLNKNGIKDGGEPGISGRKVNLQSNNVDDTTDLSGNYLFALDNGNYSVEIINSTNDYRFLTSANSTYFVTIANNNSSANDFGLKTALVSISPNTGYRGTVDTFTVVADEPIFIPGGLPGNIQYSQIMSNPVINIYSNYVIDSVTAQFIGNIGSNTAIASNIDIQVRLGSGFVGTHKLKQQFNIANAPSSVTGTVYDDLDKDGIKDAGEPGVSSQHMVKLLSGGTYTYSSNGNYSLPALNGNFSVKVDPTNYDYMFPTSEDTLTGTVNNNISSGNDFGMKRAIVSITPNFGFQGVTTTHQIVADEPIFAPGTTMAGLYLYTNPGSLWIPGGTIIDSFTVQVNIGIPLSTVVGNNRDISVVLLPGQYKYHYLKQQFDILPSPNNVSGTFFLDQNQNKLKDAGEPGISGGRVLLSPDSSFGYTDNAGNFLLGSYGGIQTLTYSNVHPLLQLTTDSTSYTFNASGALTGKDFGFNSNLPDYTVDINSNYLRPRCNTDQYASLHFYNMGNINTDVVAWIKYDSLMTYISSPITPSLITADTIFWNLSNVVPLVLTEIKALFTIPGAGNVIHVSYGIHSVDGTGTIQDSDVYNRTYSVTCSMDPNDKQVTPPGIMALNYTLMTDTLEYLIRFQNTGNDTAYKVVVLDTLDNNLNLNTFEILGSSHSMQTEVESNGAARFTFNNIMLPDSFVNEPASNGYIRYRIRAKAGTLNYTPVNNTAHIFFDFNTDVVTNTTLNTLVYVLPSSINESMDENNGVSLYPNPFQNSATLYFENSAAEKFELYISNLAGKRVAPVQNTTGDTFTIQGNRLAKGIYFYELINTLTGNSRYGKLVVE